MYYYSPVTKGFLHSSIHNHIPADAISISDEKYAELLNGLNSGHEILVNGSELSVTNERAIKKTWNDIRQQRNAILRKTDYTQTEDWPGDKAAWKTYRQALRDITMTFSDPNTVIWPEQPNG